MKKLGILFATIIMVMLFAVSASAATEGYYTYTVDDGQASITDVDASISGDITIPSTLGGYNVTKIGDYAFEGCKNLISIVIPDSVTAIGYRAYYLCWNLVSVTMGDGVTIISNYAFDGCDSLISINVDEDNAAYSSEDGVLFNKNKTVIVRYPIGKTNQSYIVPDSVITIERDVFYCCDMLTSVTIGAGVTAIANEAFEYCKSLISINVDEDNDTYSSDSEGVLFNKNKTELILYPAGKNNTSYTIPDGIITIGDHAFFSCSSLTSVVIPESVTKIGFYAFGNCDKLINVSVPDSAINIECTAFWGTACHNDENNWEQGVFYLGNHLLDAVDNIENLVVRNGTVSIAGGVFVFNDSIKSIIIPDSVSTINRSAFDCCSNLETVIMGNGVTAIGDAVFRNCKSLTNISLSNNLTTIGGSAFASCDKLTSITIPNNVTSIGSAAFMSCDNLVNITIPDGITSISSSMFYLCENLKDIIIPDNVTSIEYNAFLFCENLSSISLSDNVTFIGNSAFYGCYKLKDVYYAGNEEQWQRIEISEDNTTLTNTNIHYLIEIGICGDNVTYTYNLATKELVINGIGDMYDYNSDNSPFYNSDIKNVVIKEGVTRIGNRFFYGSEKLTGIAIPNSLNSIGEYALSGCISLVSIDIGEDNDNYCTVDNVIFDKSMKKLILYPAGKECTEYTILDGITSIDKGAFSSAKNLISVIIPNSVISIGNDAFSSCENLINITIPDSVTDMGAYVFRYCYSIESVIIGDGVTEIDNMTFDYCYNLTSVVIGNGVKSIGWYAFASCDNLVSISFPDSITYIHNYAFDKCRSLTDVYYSGTADQWREIDISSGNEYLENANFHYHYNRHSYNLVITVPTCLLQGYTTYTCECGDTYVADYVDANGHSYSSEITIPATHLKEGVETFTCHCGDTYDEPIAKLEEHSYVANVILPTCSKNGYTEHICECGKSYVSDYVGMIAHSYVYSVIKPSSHLVEGLGRYTCSKCGYHYDEAIAKTKEHSYTAILVNSTCINQGYTLNQCECGESFKSNYLAKTDHNDSNADGVCDKCGYEITANCYCNCHAGGIKGLIFKIILFFQKLFRMNRICEGCGVSHY